MPEINLDQYLRQIDHAVEGMREPENAERDHEINAIQTQVRCYLQALEKNDNSKVKLAIIAGLDNIAPRVEALVQTSIEIRPTYPAPPPDDGKSL